MAKTTYRYAWIAVLDTGSLEKLQKETLAEGIAPPAETLLAPLSVYIIDWQNVEVRLHMSALASVAGTDPTLRLMICGPKGDEAAVRDWLANKPYGQKLKAMAKHLELVKVSAEVV